MDNFVKTPSLSKNKRITQRLQIRSTHFSSVLVSFHSAKSAFISVFKCSQMQTYFIRIRIEIDRLHELLAIFFPQQIENDVMWCSWHQAIKICHLFVISMAIWNVIFVRFYIYIEIEWFVCENGESLACANNSGHFSTHTHTRIGILDMVAKLYFSSSFYNIIFTIN